MGGQDAPAGIARGDMIGAFENLVPARRLFSRISAARLSAKPLAGYHSQSTARMEGGSANEATFTHHGHRGRVIVSVATTSEPAVLGAISGAIGLANCTATVAFAGRGYLQLLGWVQLVRYSDNAFHFMGASSKWTRLILSGSTSTLRRRTAGMASHPRSSMRPHEKRDFAWIGWLQPLAGDGTPQAVNAARWALCALYCFWP